jgi:thiamine pyrophosphokinase
VGDASIGAGMIQPLHRAAGPVTLVGGGPVDPAALAAALALAPEAVAADGGGDVALPAGVEFAAVIGDMDSLRDPEALRGRGVPLHPVAEQDTTDLEKCLTLVEATLFLGLGFLGGRIDHHLAAMNALVRHRDRPTILIGGEDLCMLCPPELDLTLDPGARVSLFPMRPATGVISEGLRWSVAGLAFAPDGRIGTSNVALGGRMRVGFDAPGVLAILPVGLLDQVVARLAPGWPA